MFDGSHLPFREKLAITRHLVTLAHSKGISVEAELGTIAGSEDGIVNSEVIYADPQECYTTVTETRWIASPPRWAPPMVCIKVKPDWDLPR